MSEDAWKEALPWQRRQWERLQARRRAGSLPHALLLAGPAGVGKTRFARRLAASLLCDEPEAAGDPCGRCRGCHLVQVGTHPDLVVVEPATGQGAILAEQVRALGGFVARTSHFDGPRVALIRAAERMNLHAANGLLKTLEEPPPGCVLVLVSAAPARLTATVRSRCQVLVFQLPARDEALGWLAPRLEAGADVPRWLDSAAGAPLEALEGARSDALARRERLLGLYTDVLRGGGDPVAVAETWCGEELARNLAWLVGWHEDMIRLKMSASPPRLQNPDLREALGRIAAGLGPRELFHRLDEARGLGRLVGTQVNPRLMMEAFLAGCHGRWRPNGQQ